MPISRLEPVPLRELWKHEEHGFSAWLQKNIELLADKLGTPLSDVQRGKQVGSFYVDLTAEDEDGGLVIIENQLEPTNHDHLGKLITYLTNLDAKKAIWLTSEPRPEHVRAVLWLNETTPHDIAFYLVKIEAYRIGSSDPAPLFTVVASPSPETKDIGEEKEDLAERHILRLEFWSKLLARANEKGVTLHSGRSPSKDNWLSAGSGKSGIHFNYVIWLEGGTAVELYIDTGDGDQNKRIFDHILANKEKIERNFGAPLMWERLDNRRASRIRYVMECEGLRDTASWASIQDRMIDAMDRFSGALRPQLDEFGT